MATGYRVPDWWLEPATIAALVAPLIGVIVMTDDSWQILGQLAITFFFGGIALWVPEGAGSRQRGAGRVSVVFGGILLLVVLLGLRPESPEEAAPGFLPTLISLWVEASNPMKGLLIASALAPVSMGAWRVGVAARRSRAEPYPRRKAHLATEYPRPRKPTQALPPLPLVVAPTGQDPRKVYTPRTPLQLVEIVESAGTTIAGKSAIQPHVGKWLQATATVDDVWNRMGGLAVQAAITVGTSRVCFDMTFTGDIERVEMLGRGDEIKAEGAIHSVTLLPGGYGGRISLEHCRLLSYRGKE